MTRTDALEMILEYSRYALGVDDVLFGIAHRFPSDGSEAKSMRWLGFCQGVLCARGVFTLDDLKQHSMTRSIVPISPYGCRILDQVKDAPKQVQDGVYDRHCKRWLPVNAESLLFDEEEIYCRPLQLPKEEEL